MQLESPRYNVARCEYLVSICPDTWNTDQTKPLPLPGDEKMSSLPDNSDPAKAAIVLLEILKRGEQQIRDGNIRPTADVLNDLHGRRKST